jgi:hypothetical protein
LGRNGYNDFVINSGGLISIGTTTSSYPLDVNGIIHTNTSIQSPKYDLSYSTVPTLTNTSLGYAILPSFSVTLPAYLGSNLSYGHTFTNLPIGVYLIQAYAIGIFITTAVTYIKLGLNITYTTPTAYNFTHQILPILSTTVPPTNVQSISYNFYLSNTSVTTYYIMFTAGPSINPFGNGSSITNFDAKFIRIA